MMTIDGQQIARKEIHETLRLVNFCIRRIGLSFIDGIPKTVCNKLRTHLTLIVSSTLLFFMLLGEYAYIVVLMLNSPSIEDLLGSYLHIAGYDTMSFGKLITIWYKRHIFRQLVTELADIWPVSLPEEEAAAIKRNSLSALKQRQILYAFWNVLGVWLYNLTPIAILVYYKIIGVSSQLGNVWQMAYPFDKTAPVYHEIVYVLETCSGWKNQNTKEEVKEKQRLAEQQHRQRIKNGIISVCCMLGSDLLFMTMASHISMLLRLLQVRIRNLIVLDDEENTLESVKPYDCYQEIILVVKVHQRLIKYINDLEDAFCIVNLINVLLSSVNICCVVFAIVFLESWMEMSNKFFLGAALTQMGIVCWYADDIYRASIGVADAVYESGWYRCNVRCRRALFVVLQRSQKPLYFTALKFRAITMTTYSSILTTAYSYFTLLYTSYRRN